MSLELIKLEEKDYSFIKETYDYYILNTTATFHLDPLSIEEIKQFILLDDPIYKSFVIRHENVDCGYCYFSPFKKRPAYNRTAEITIYLKPGFQGKGIGKHVINLMVNMAKEDGFKVLIAGITAENTASILLFEKSGFEKCAHYKQVGEKFNKTLDVVAYEKILS